MRGQRCVEAREQAVTWRRRALGRLSMGGTSPSPLWRHSPRTPLPRRLLCLATHAPGGLPRQPWEGLSRALLHSYGHEHCLTLQDLRRCGLACARDGGKSAYTLLKRPMGMLVDSLDELDPSDCAYVFGGYAPLW